MPTRLSKVAIKGKILLILALPLLGFVGFCAYSIVQHVRTATEAGRVRAFAELSVRASLAIHEMQKERGMSSIFLASKGAKFRSELDAQRAETDRRVESLQAFVREFNRQVHDAPFQSRLQQAAGLFSDLAPLRSSIDGLQIPGGGSFARYTGMISAWLDCVDAAAGSSQDAGLVRQLSAYGDYLRFEEYNGQERAVLGSAFAADQFDPALIQRYFSVLATQQVYMNRFRSAAGPRQTAMLDAFIAGDAYRQVKSYEDLAFGKLLTGGFGVSPSTWFQAITAKIEAESAIEHTLSDEIAHNTDAMRSSARRKLILTTAAMLLALCASFLIAFSVCTRMVSSLHAVVGRAKEIASGKLNGEPLSRLSQDEIGELTGAVNAMQENLARLLELISRAAGQLACASHEMTAITSLSAEQAAGQARQTELVEAAVYQMTTALAQVTELSNNAATEAQSAAQGALTTGQIVSASIATMRDIAASSEEMATRVVGLGRGSDEVGKAVVVIDEIANQTNLLALNANIEAARAGEAGRGFSIVANEVRRLAERTAKATREIGELVTGIQTETRATVETMHRDSAAVHVGVEKTEAVPESLKRVIGASQRIGDMIAQIAAATVQQLAATREISQNVSAITSLAQNASQSAAQSAGACLDLSKLAAEMQGLVGTFELAEA